MAIDAGKFDRRIRLERRVETKGRAGDVVITWQTVATVWAVVRPMGGREAFGQQQVIARGDVEFKIRWRRDVDPLHLVVYEGLEYDVTSTAIEGRRELLVIVGTARTERRAP